MSRSLEDYLIDASLEDLVIVDASGMTRSGHDLQDLLIRARQIRNSINALTQKAGNRRVVEQAAIAGAFDDAVFENEGLGAEYATKIAARLNNIEPVKERTWRAEFTPVGGYAIERTPARCDAACALVAGSCAFTGCAPFAWRFVLVARGVCRPG